MSTGQGAAAVLCGWEDNRGSGIALAMGHKLCGISTYGLNGIRKVDRRPAYTLLQECGIPLMQMHSLLSSTGALEMRF